MYLNFITGPYVLYKNRSAHYHNSGLTKQPLSIELYWMKIRNHIQDKGLRKHYRWCILQRKKAMLLPGYRFVLKTNRAIAVQWSTLGQCAELLRGLFCLHLCCGWKGRFWFLFDKMFISLTVGRQSLRVGRICSIQFYINPDTYSLPMLAKSFF